MSDKDAIDITTTLPATKRRKPPVEKLYHIRAFEEYYKMGDRRSHPKVAKKFGKSVGVISQWSRDFGWVQRVMERDREIGDKLQLESVEEITESRKNILLILRSAVEAFIKRKDGEDVPEKIEGFKLRNVADLKEAYLLMEEIRNPGTTLTKKAGEVSSAQQVNIIIQK